MGFGKEKGPLRLSLGPISTVVEKLEDEDEGDDRARSLGNGEKIIWRCPPIQSPERVCAKC